MEPAKFTTSLFFTEDGGKTHGSPEKSIKCYQSLCHYNPKDSVFHNHRRENLTH
jgi:hypothetical protein